MSQNVEQLRFQICQKDIFIKKNKSKHTNKLFLKIIRAMQDIFQQILWTVRKRGKHLRPGAKIWNGVRSIVGVAALRRE